MLWLLMRAIEDDRFSALLVGVALAAALYVGLRLLRFPMLSPPLLYLCVFALFHLGLALPWALGVYDGPLPGWFRSHRLTPALGLVELAILFYLAGLVWARRRAAPPPAAPVYTNRFLFGCGVAIYLAGAVMFFLGVERVGGTRFWDAGYAEIYRLAAQFDPRLFGTSFLIVPIGLYLAAASFSRRWTALVAALTLAWVGGIFFLGFRGFALIPGLVVLALMRHRRCRPPAWMSVALLLVVLAAIPLARAVRDQRIGERSLEGVWNSVRLLDGIVEMGGSLRPLVHTLEYLDQQSWRWGKTYWQSLGTVWPNLAGQWEGARYLALDDLPPNHWLTLQADPDLYHQAGGLGFSAVAEPYMNFGVTGVLVYFWVLGALLARAAELRSTRPAPLAAWAMVLGPLLWTTRNSFEVFFRPALWGLAIVLGARLGWGVVASFYACSDSQ
ncbi:MAG: O-antigen polysaccharide polymerase Wzy [Acidobacteria bacterium]|nr:O-antigen polysaccharide polymerase Wzy [Acidobacteriota bacterium]